MKQIFSRMGDGSALWLSAEELRHELRTGTEDAADRGKIAPLSDDELERLFEICAAPQKVVSLEPGQEVVHSFDAGSLKFPIRGGVPVDRLGTVMAHERAFCSDTFEVGHTDYSFKPVKAIISEERQAMEQIQLNATIPVYYGAMPNLGLYTKPDGPIDNWSELLPLGKVPEAREAQEKACEMAVKDIYFVAEAMHEAGSDGINFDTVGASGDADFLASLLAVEKLKKAMPDMHIDMGMASEFVLGMHGGLKYDDTRLAGLYCHKQLELAQKAGVDIFGPVINTKSNMSVPWNIARACTFVKACSEISNIPIHPNAGMGVGGVPVTSTAPVDAISRASVALIEIGKADGL
jgi:dimethylamine---corrinoid protein Co-methyltransferase